ncbi:MAG: DUF3945 domain-containing protein [Rikenellaceae bacterium]
MDVNKEAKQDVLLTEDGESGKMKVVAGLDDEGKLKTVSPKQANDPDFMKIDRHGNALDNFLSNYFAQVKNPRHTGFYRVAKDGIEEIAGVISGLLKNGGKEGEEFLKEYKVDTSKYERQDVDMARGAEEECEPHGQLKPQEQKQEYKPLDADKIDWEAFAKIGISRESLEKSGALESMLNYRRSPNLHPITMTIDDMKLNTDARLSLRQADDGRVIPVIHAVRKEPELDRPFYGNTFTAEDKKSLLESGNLGRTINLNIKGVENRVPAYVSIDPKTNELVAYSSKNVRVPNEIKGVTLDDRQKQDLREGRAVYLEGMTAKSGKSFNASVQINAAERGITFRFDEKRQVQQQSQGQDAVRIPNKLGGVQLTDEQRADLKKGEVVYIESLTDKKGDKYNAYVKVNEEKGKLDFYKWDPRKNQEHSTKQDAKVDISDKSLKDDVKQEQSRGRKM